VTDGEKKKIAEELRELTAMRYAGDCKCGGCQLVPRKVLDRAIAALSAPEVKIETGSLSEIVSSSTTVWLVDGGFRFYPDTGTKLSGSAREKIIAALKAAERAE